MGRQQQCGTRLRPERLRDQSICSLQISPTQKTTGPFIKPPLTTCRAAHTHTHTHTLRRTPLHTRLSLSTFLFWQIFNVKVCNMPKLKTFAKFWGVFTWTNEAEQLYSVVALSVVIFITLKKSHFAKKMWFFSTFFHKPNKALSYPSS